MSQFPRIQRLGEQAILLEFEPQISPDVLQKVLACKKYFEKELVKEEVEITNTYNSLLVTYKSTIEDAYDKVLGLVKSLEEANIEYKTENRLFHLPVCYDGIFAPDLDEISEAKNLSKKEIIRLHSSAEYLVYFIGFLPGFLYLGGLPESLYFSRKRHPRLEVKKGAVGIGEKQTGIYPQTSPGGWNIIGNCPVPLFNPASNPPCEIKPGDRIKFYPVSLAEYREFEEQVQKDIFQFKIEQDG